MLFVCHLSQYIFMDSIDLRILAELQRDGRISNRALADRISLSAAPCWRRLQQLEQSGVISRYTALLDRSAIGLQILAFAHISLDDHHPNTVAQFDKAVADRGEVLECHMTSGAFDYMLKVVVENIEAYERFLNECLLPIPGVHSVNSSFSLREKKFTTMLPLVSAR